MFPRGFINSLQGVAGFEKDDFIKVHEQTPLTSVRLNPQKPSPATAYLPLQQQVSWCNTGWHLLQRPSFTLDPVFHGGAYYVQEASSMFLDYMVREIYKSVPPPRRVLDLCGAPGGKATLLAAALPQSLVVANEVIRTRVSVLSENIIKWGSDNVVVTGNDPADFKRLAGYFDLMVVDAPCSGSGLFRKDPSATSEWSEANVEMCSLRQKRILTDCIGALKQDGYLIYSTCSYSIEENEDICDWLMDTYQLQPVKIPVDASWRITETVSGKHKAFGFRFYPNHVLGEGFFIACFRQVNEAGEYRDYNNNLPVLTKQFKALAASFIKNPEEFFFVDQKEFIRAIPIKWKDEIATLTKALHLRKSGVAVGAVKGKDFIPHHELALSHLLTDDTPFVKLSKEDALRYLRRQDLTLDTSPNGWTICTYEDINIGWIKVLPNRVNNYYPLNWRILKM